MAITQYFCCLDNPSLINQSIKVKFFSDITTMTALYLAFKVNQFYCFRKMIIELSVLFLLNSNL